MALSRAKYKRRSGEEIKNPNNLKVTVLKQVSKNLLPDKFSENRFFLSCTGIGDRYSKLLLSRQYDIEKWLSQTVAMYSRGVKISVSVLDLITEHNYGAT